MFAHSHIDKLNTFQKSGESSEDIIKMTKEKVSKVDDAPIILRMMAAMMEITDRIPITKAIIPITNASFLNICKTFFGVFSTRQKEEIFSSKSVTVNFELQ